MSPSESSKSADGSSRSEGVPQAPGERPSDLIRARREKLRWLREELGIEPYGQRVDGLVPLADARASFDADATARAEADPNDDDRAVRAVAGRVVQHRVFGKLAFIVLRDDTGDLQVSISKADVDAETFRLAKKLDYGDVVVAGGPIGATKKGEVCVWARELSMHAKSLVPPPGKHHGLVDPEIRYRHRYVDMWSNPETVRVFRMRSRIVSHVRRFMEARGYLEVETPMMQPMAGGAAARPFTTHHNALGIPLFMRIAPELYLKRLLVGGMPKVFEINRNFRNEGIDRSHNPEFTAMEAYEAFGDYETMAELTESLLHELAVEARADRIAAGEDAAMLGTEECPVLPFGELRIRYPKRFTRVRFEELFERALGFSMRDEAKVRARAADAGIEDHATRDHWLLVNELFEHGGEDLIDPQDPTFVYDYPAVISPLTRPNRADPAIAERWDVFIGGMEVGPAYTELNDPDIQEAKFGEQLAGEDDEESTFRSMDEDFLESLRVGMPPAGGLGLGIDRIVMLLTDSASIRDVILFPLMRPVEGDGAEGDAAEQVDAAGATG